MNGNKIEVLLEVQDRGSRQLQAFGSSVERMSRSATSSFSTMKKASDQFESGVVRLKDSLGQLAAAYLGVQGAKAILSIADTYTQLEGRLKLVTDSASELAYVQEHLYTSANTVRTSYESHADLYARIARSMGSYNLSADQTIAFTEAVSRSMVVSGATTQEASSFMIQFGQALASNRLQGEEFRAMLESNSRAVQVLTDYLGVDIETLRKMAKEGELTADVLYNAFSASSKKLKSEAEAMPKTVAQAMEHLKNAGKLLVAETNKSSEATKSLTGTIDDLAVSVEDSRDELVAMFSDMTTGAINAAREAGELVPVINSIYGASSQLLGLNAGEWGIIGFALLRGGPQAAALTGAILTINSALGELGLGLGNLGAAWKGYSESMQNIGDVLSGKRDWQTGEWIDQQSAKIEGLETKLANLQRQAASTGETFTTGFEVGVTSAAEESAALNAEIAETEAALDAARSASELWQSGIKSTGVDVNNLANYTDVLSVGTGKLSGEMGTLESKTGAAGKAADGAAESKKNLTRESNAAAKAAKDLAREEEALAREAEATGRAMIRAAADRQAATRELSENLRKSLAEQLREEYAATAAGYDAREQLAQDHADWVRSLQEGLLSDIESGISGFVYDFLTGEFDSIADLFDSLCNSILRAFANLIAEMVAKWAMSGLVGLFTGQGFSGFNVGALGLGQGGVTSGWGDSISALVGGGSSVALSQYGPYASGYATGGGAAAGVTGAQAAGSALGVAGGAYGLYNAAGQVASGNANAGTALQAGISAYSIYKGYPTVAAYLSSLGGTAATGTAAAAYTGAGSLAYGQTGSVVMNAMLAEKMGAAAGSAIVAETAAAGTTAAAGSTATAGTTAAAGGSAGAGLSTGAMVGGGAIMGIGALIAMGMGGKAQQEFYSPRYGNVPFNDYGHDDLQDMIRAGRSGYNWVSEAQPGSMSGSGDAGITQTVADLERAFKQFESNTRIVLDVLAAAGDGVASLGQQLEDGTLSTAAFVDAIAGYDVSIQETATLTGLASEAARGNGSAMDALRAALQSMGLGADQAEIAALALVAASNNQATSLYAASDAAGAAASAVQSMAGKIQELSSTPLNIRVKVNVDVPYGGGDDYMAPRHADGGIFIGPTLIPSINGRRHLVGEAGAEAITPLHAGPDTLKKMDAKLDALLSGGRPVQYVINLDGRQIASATLPYVDAHVAGKASRGALTRRTVF